MGDAEGGTCTFLLERTKRKGLPCGKKDHKEHPGLCRVHYKAVVLKRLKEPMPQPPEEPQQELPSQCLPPDIGESYSDYILEYGGFPLPMHSMTERLTWDEDVYKKHLDLALVKLDGTSQLLKNS